MPLYPGTIGGNMAGKKPVDDKRPAAPQTPTLGISQMPRSPVQPSPIPVGPSPMPRPVPPTGGPGQGSGGFSGTPSPVQPPTGGPLYAPGSPTIGAPPGATPSGPLNPSIPALPNPGYSSGSSAPTPTPGGPGGGSGYPGVPQPGSGQMPWGGNPGGSTGPAPTATSSAPPPIFGGALTMSPQGTPAAPTPTPTPVPRPSPTPGPGGGGTPASPFPWYDPRGWFGQPSVPGSRPGAPNFPTSGGGGRGGTGVDADGNEVGNPNSANFRR